MARFYYLLLNVLIVLFLFACKEDKGDVYPGNLESGEIQITIIPSLTGRFDFSVAARSITVDWGDGQVESFTSYGDLINPEHEYPDINPYTILVTTENLSVFKKDEDSKGRIGEILFGSCNELKTLEICWQLIESLDLRMLKNIEHIDVTSNQLTEVNLKGLSAVREIHIGYNQLSVNTINQIFKNLPKVSGKDKIIYIEYDLFEQVKSSVAFEKGWTIGFASSRVPLATLTFETKEVIHQMINSLLSYTSALQESLNYLELFYTARFPLDRGPWVSYPVSPENSLIQNNWEIGYRNINFVNTILQSVKELKYTEYDKEKYIATLEIFRSMFYFDLLQIWGDMPYIENSFLDWEGTLLYRESADHIVDDLIERLIAADLVLPQNESVDDFLFSNYFSKALLARLYLYKKDYNSVINYTKSIINSGQFELSSELEKIFNSKTDKEFITSHNPIAYYKYNEVRKGEYSPLMRYAEVLLMAAEAHMQTGKITEAVELVNQLRTRNSRPLVSAENLFEGLLEEYDLDLYKEGLYFNCLNRLGVATEILGIEEYQCLLPIPSSMINLGVKQNPGYK